MLRSLQGYGTVGRPKGTKKWPGSKAGGGRQGAGRTCKTLVEPVCDQNACFVNHAQRQQAEQQGHNLVNNEEISEESKQDNNNEETQK